MRSGGRIKPAVLLIALWLGAMAWLVTAAETGGQGPDGQGPDGQGPDGQGVVKVELEPQQITVGDRVKATVTLLWEGERPTAAPRFPAWQDTWGGAEVLAVGEIESFPDQSARFIYKQELTLTAFRPEEVELPPLALVVPLAGQTVDVAMPEGLGFTVTSILPSDEESLEPRPATAVRPPADPRLFWPTFGVLLALSAAAVWLLLRHLGRGGIEGIADRPRLAPLDELLERLKQLDPSVGSEPVHTGLSQALRDYLGRRLGFNALESTTSEIQRRLRQGPVPVDLYQRTLGLLRDCDQVKFARHDVPHGVTGERLAQAPELARRIETSVAPPAPAEEAAG